MAIQLLLQRFAAYADTATDNEAYLALVTDDAEFSYAPVPSIEWQGETHTCRDAIRQGVQECTTAPHKMKKTPVLPGVFCGGDGGI